MRHPARAGLWAATAALVILAVSGLFLWQHLSAKAALSKEAAARAEAEAVTAQADRDRIQAEQDNQRLQRRTGAQQALLKASEALRQERPDLAQVRALAAGALGQVHDDPALHDLEAEAARIQAEAGRRELVQRNYAELPRHLDEAFFHLSRQLFTGLDLPQSLALARQHAGQGLGLFGVTPDPGNSLVFDDLHDRHQRDEITQNCFALLLIQAEALTHPLLPPGAQRAGAAEALRAVDRADRLLPDTRTVHRRRARYLRLLGDGAAAEREGRLAGGREAATPLDAFLTGYDAGFVSDRVNEGQLREAVRLFDEALGQRGDLFWAHFFRALAYQRLQNLGMAEAGLTICASQRPTFVWPHLLLAFVHGELAARAEPGAERTAALAAAEKDLERAAALLERAERSPSTEAARYVLTVNRGVLRLRQAQALAPLASLRPAGALLPIPARLCTDLALAGQGRSLAEASSLLQEAARRMPREPDTYVDLARVHEEQARLARKQGDLRAAEALLGRAVEQAGKALALRGSAPLYRTRAQLHLSRKRVRSELARQQDRPPGHEPRAPAPDVTADREAARQDLEHAIRLEEADLRRGTGGSPPALAADHVELAWVLFDGRRYEDAVREADAALRLREDLAAAHRVKGLALFRLQRYPAAVAALDRCLQTGPPAAETYQFRALALRELGRYRAALDDCDRALALRPEDARLRAVRGWLYLANESPALALADFEESLRLDADNADAYSGRGHARVRLAGSRRALAGAVADAETSVRRAPRDRRLAFNAARIYAQAVGRLDADRIDRSGVAALEERAQYQDRALALLRVCLRLTPSHDRPAFWQEQVARDAALNPIRVGPGWARLALEFSGANRASR